MLDVAAFGAFILYKENNPQSEIEIQSNNIQIMRHFGPRSGLERRSYKSTSY